MTLILPSPELQIVIRQTLNEDINSRDASLEAIKEWLAKQPHLPDTWDEDRLLNFLRGTNFSLEKCKRKLDCYFTIRTPVPEFFSNRDINRPELLDIMSYAYAIPLPRLTPEGRRVTFICSKYKKVPIPLFENSLKIMTMIGDIRLGEEKYGVTGDVYIFDVSPLTTTLLASASFSTIQKFLKCVQEAYPVKLKEIHVLNHHPLIEIIIKWIKPFVKNKIMNRVHLHNDLESLYRFVPKDVLPEEYGGAGGKLQPLHDSWINQLKQYTTWFEQQENIKADESRRPGTPINYDELFGVDGSFRALAID